MSDTDRIQISNNIGGTKMVKTYCVSVLGMNVMDCCLNDLQDVREFRAQTKLTDFCVAELEKSLGEG